MYWNKFLRHCFIKSMVKNNIYDIQSKIFDKFILCFVNIKLYKLNWDEKQCLTKYN